jgi:hypothetical protein
MEKLGMPLLAFWVMRLTVFFPEKAPCQPWNATLPPAKQSSVVM